MARDFSADWPREVCVVVRSGKAKSLFGPNTITVQLSYPLKVDTAPKVDSQGEEVLLEGKGV